MKRISGAAIFVSTLLSWNCTAAFAGVVGTQCWINGKLVGGFPPRYVCPGTGGGSGPPPAPAFDFEAERQRQEEERLRQEEERLRQEEAERQREAEVEAERKRKKEEAAKIRQEEFERRGKEALKSMKGITEGELGPKGSDSGVFGLKEIGDPGTSGAGLKDIPSSPASPERKSPDCEWGSMGPSVVDLRCLGLDPDKPIAVDPHVVKGKERVFPAQIDPETFKNANYNKGFDALKRFDVASAAQAIQYFEQARKERPKDPLVRNGLLLAQDIHKARQQKEKDNQAKAAYFTLQSYASMMICDVINARHYAEQALQYDPSNNQAKYIQSLSKIDLGSADTYPKRKEAYQLVSSSLVSIYKQHYPVALDMLEAAQRLQPGDKFIGMFLQEMRKYVTAARRIR
jgi:tetratricopeptide (TPR) repeat protein